MLVTLNRAKKFSGSVCVPPDKSITHRAILLSALADGVSTIENPLQAEDCMSTARCVEELGCRIEKKGSKWKVHGVGLWGFKEPSRPLNCGNSGTTMRLLAGILAAQDFKSELVGDDSLSKRPMERVANPLRSMGAHLDLRQGKYAPMFIRGNRFLKPIHWKNAVASAQVKSSVLLAGLHAKGETSFEEPFLSRDHTERMLKACGVKINREGSRVTVQGPAHLKPQSWKVPGDMSSAAFFLVGGTLIKGARLKLVAVNLNPTRIGLLQVLRNSGAKIEIKNKRELGGEPVGDLLVTQQPPLKPFKIDESISPTLIDEIPILAVMATQAKGRSVMTGLKELRLKETDRLSAIAKNLRAMGAKVKENPNGLIIDGPTLLKGAELDSFHDHRIAMAFAIAAFLAQGKTVIKGSECVAISYPTFWDDLGKLSGQD